MLLVGSQWHPPTKARGSSALLQTREARTSFRRVLRTRQWIEGHLKKERTSPRARGAGDGTAATPPLGIENTDPTYMSWTATATGNWSAPVLVLGPKVEMDTNMAAVIKADGSLVGQWRDHYPGGKHSTPHLVTAANWKDPATYKYSKEDLLFGKSKNPGAIEDMFMWVDGRGHYHCVYHQMYTCETCTAHAFSEDGIEWTYPQLAERFNLTANVAKGIVRAEVNFLRRAKKHELQDFVGHSM